MPAVDSSWRRDALVALAGGVLLLSWELGGADLVVTRWFASAAGFAWRDLWWTSTLLHEGARAASWLVMAFLVLDGIFRIVRGPTREQRLIGLASVLACVLVVPGIKRFSQTSCPWDLAEFGGMASYVPHWRFGVVDGGPGHCFPSGHAVAAFAFLSVYFMLRPSRPVAARGCLVAVCVAGVLLGGTQVVRGAHYVSHVLWSAWLCWVICAAFAAAARPSPAASTA
jgi:membrane-associated PAP2 superfamily phosphatase